MKNKDKTKAQLTDELAEMPEQIAGLEESGTKRKQAGEAVQRNRAWLPTASMFVLLCVLVWLTEILDLPHLLLDTPRSPINWQEAIIEMALIASVGLFTVLRLLHDMTGRRRAEERERKAIAAAAAAQMAIDTIEAMGDGLILHTMDGKMTSINPAFEKMTGYQQSELVGKDAADIAQKVVKPKDLKKTMGAIKAALGGKVSVSTPITLVSKEGRETPVTFIVSLIQDAAGAPTTVVVVFRDITKLKQAEETLRESEQWLSTILRSIGDAVIATDAKGLVTLMNSVAGDLTGWDEAEAVGQPMEDVFNIINEQTGQQAENPVTRVLREGVVVGLANYTVLIAKDGTKRPIADSGAPMTDEEGNIIGAVIVFRDITERRKAEEQLRKHRDHLEELVEERTHALQEAQLYTRGIIEASLDGLVTISAEGKITDINQAMELVTGLSRQEIIGTDFSNYFTDPGAAREGYRQVFQDGYIQDYPLEIKHRDGKVTPVLYNASVYKDAQGRIAGVFAAARDVTERRRAEEELIRLSNAVRMSIDSIVISDLEGKIIEVNEATLKSYGTDDKGDLIGKSSFDLIAPEDREKAFAGMEEVLKKGYTEGREYHIITKDGGRTPVEMSVAIMKDVDGEPAGFVGINRDITERKRAEEELRLAASYVRGLIEASLDSLVTIGPDGKITDVNQATELVTGVSRERLVGSVFSNYFTEPEKAREGYQHVFSQGAVEDYPLTIRHTSGRTTDVLYNASVYRNEAGEVQGVFAAARDITERKRAEEQISRQNAVLEAINKVFRGTLTCESDEELAAICLAVLEELTGSKFGFLGELNQAGLFDTIAISNPGWEACRVPGSEATKLIGNMEIRGVDRSTLREGESRIVNDVSSHPDSVGVPEGHPPVNCFLGVPLKDEGRAIGMIGLANKEGGYELADREAVEAVSVAIVEALRRKRAQEALQRYTERLRTLRAIDGAILAAWEPEEIAQAALRHMRRLVPCLGAGVVMFDFEAQEATVFALHANGEAGLETGTRFSLKGVLDINALRQGKVHVVGDILASPQPVWLTQALQAAGVRSYITAPLIAHGELMGVLGLGSESPGAFTPEHVDIAHEVADQLAVGLRQAHLRAALEAEEQRLAVLVEHLPGGILLLDGERRILLANPAAQTYLPLLADAAVGDVLTLMADRPVEEILEAPSEGLWHELQVSGPPLRVFEVVARPVAAAPKAEGWMLVIRDVTQEREVQRRVQRQERLAAVGQLAGGIAHDFNNLLTTIMLYAQLPLGKHDLPPDLTRALETIIGESRQAAKLVQQILDFSRRSPIETHPVDLKPFVEEAVRVLERTIPESISLLLEVEPEECVVNADPTRIQQVLMNLVINARDAMPEGGELRIDLSRVEVGPGEGPPVAEMVPGEWVCLAVSDTGTGIPPEVLAHIFEPFFTTKEPGKGTGLGLAQVDGIVAQHEGHIGVETELGQGTTFRVYLPAYGVEALEKVGAEAASALPQGKGETILLVEDHERIREVARQLLEPLGYRVLTAANGREALEVYRVARSGDRPQQGVDLVITDVVMPEMGGKRLMRELRKTHPGLKALAMTGYIVEENVHELRKEGFLDVVYKPFDVDRLAQVVRRVLDED